MQSLPILHYLLDHHYNEPTRIYAVMEQKNGDLIMNKIYEFRQDSIQEIAHFFRSMEVRRPIVLVDAHPQVAYILKQEGFRVR